MSKSKYKAEEELPIAKSDLNKWVAAGEKAPNSYINIDSYTENSSENIVIVQERKGITDGGKQYCLV